MIEDYIEEAYPKTVALKDGREASIRLFTPEDADRLLACYADVPAIEQALLWDDMTDPNAVERLSESSDIEYNVPLIAEMEGKVVAAATLIRTPNRWTKHAALVRIVVRPDYRRLGLARQMVSELKEIALHAGISLLNAECVAEEKDAIALFSNLGYVRVAHLPAYVQDSEGRPHDLVIMLSNIRAQEAYGGGD
ncbi:MAG: GNAT family N-acetyltransferase [Armatimonadetes bacterium]|nr:GNAT family N-acetyltransferase [Armatimonadota bacterium]